MAHLLFKWALSGERYVFTGQATTSRGHVPEVDSELVAIWAWLQKWKVRTGEFDWTATRRTVTLRSEISMREAITKGCRQRCAYLVSKHAIQAVETYLQYRIERGIGTVLGNGPFRGLLPHQQLIYSSRGDGMSQNTKRRMLETGERRDYKDCDSLQAHVTKLYQRAGIKGGSSHSGRRTFAGKVLATTGDMDTVAQLLGHTSIDCSQRYVDLDQAVLKAMFMDAL